MEARKLQLAFELALASERLKLFQEALEAMLGQIAEATQAVLKFGELLEKFEAEEKGKIDAS